MTRSSAGSTAHRLFSTTAAVAFVALLAGQAAAAEELNALVWCDHTDPALIEPFEKANDVKVNLKEYEGTGAGISILEQSRPGDWDVMVIDAVDVHRVIDMGLLGEMPADALPSADLFPRLVIARRLGLKRLSQKLTVFEASANRSATFGSRRDNGAVRER